MNAGIFSLYWDNIDERVVKAQKAVFDHFGAPINQHRIHSFDHGEWIDWVMGRKTAVDVYLFLDIDCIPLSRDLLQQMMMTAQNEEALCGAEGAANHIDPSRAYAGAWFVAISRQVWDEVGRPSAQAFRHCDVCQNWTTAWRETQLPIRLIPPTACEQPKWDLPGRPKAYGIGTTYGDYCYHLFESRGQNPQPFLDKCAQVLNAAH